MIIKLYFHSFHKWKTYLHQCKRLSRNCINNSSQIVNIYLYSYLPKLHRAISGMEPKPNVLLLYYNTKTHTIPYSGKLQWRIEIAVLQSVFTDQPIWNCQNITNDKAFLYIPNILPWPQFQGHNKNLKFDSVYFEVWHILSNLICFSHERTTCIYNYHHKVYHIFFKKVAVTLFKVTRGRNVSNCKYIIFNKKAHSRLPIPQR